MRAAPRRARARERSTDARRADDGRIPKENRRERRAADIASAPTFRPTLEEFADPIAYLSSIEARAREAGICKVIPPRGATPRWNDEAWRRDDARFETKLQNVHSLSEGRTFQFGKEYTKGEYEAMAKAYEERWAKKRPDVDASDAKALERAFWDMVETRSEQARVEYGNDLDTKIFGTGFGVDENGEKHPWDFEHLYSHPLNLLRVVEHDIPGLTKPWLYLGMLFATFCWHVEDHFLCSLNYLHRGAAKTWYGVPGSDAEAFENCARATVPRLFEQAPDILHQIVTIVPPGVLVDHGVKVVHTVQQPGEFVVTFPRAYHAGFSHGFNVAEAVNFGHVNWLDFGRRAIDVYSTGSFKRNAVFAHHRLVSRAAETFVEVLGKNARLVKSKAMGAIVSTLRKELETILSDEEIYRASLVRRGLNVEIVQAPNEVDDACCIRCKTMPFLSVVRCKCLPTAVRCLRHAMDACDCAAGERTLEIRVVDSRLRELVKALFFGDGVETKDDTAKARVDFSANVNRVAVNRAPPPKPTVVVPKPETVKPPATRAPLASPPPARIVASKANDAFTDRGLPRKRAKCENRRRWTAEMVADFEAAFERLGGVDGATGKTLADALSAHGVTRDQCASRLQKHREKIRLRALVRGERSTL